MASANETLAAHFAVTYTLPDIDANLAAAFRAWNTATTSASALGHSRTSDLDQAETLYLTWLRARQIKLAGSGEHPLNANSPLGHPIDFSARRIL